MKNAILFTLITIVLFSCSNNNIENLEYSSTIEYKDLVVSSQMSGQIEKIFFSEGDFVRKEDTLLVINHEKLDLQLAQAIAAQNELLLQLKMLEKGARKEDIKLNIYKSNTNRYFKYSVKFKEGK